MQTWAVPMQPPYSDLWLILCGVHLEDGAYFEAPLTPWLEEADALDLLQRLTVTPSPDGTRLDLYLETAPACLRRP